jgi:hypothetical protein
MSIALGANGALGRIATAKHGSWIRLRIANAVSAYTDQRIAKCDARLRSGRTAKARCTRANSGYRRLQPWCRYRSCPIPDRKAYRFWREPGRRIGNGYQYAGRTAGAGGVWDQDCVRHSYLAKTRIPSPVSRRGSSRSVRYGRWSHLSSPSCRSRPRKHRHRQ